MSEIRVNTIVAAEGTSAPNLPYGIQVPTGMGITGAGGVNISGVVTAANIDGTLIAGSAINSAGVSTVGILTVTKDARIGAAVTVDGAATVTGAVNIDATTDSTSVTTGALIVDGGVGIAKNVYIGAGLSVAGTLTYEDVTSVDSVGLITAKSGVNITGGQLQVGVAYSVGAAGVATALGFVAGTSGLSGTLQTAAQTNITSVGTLAGLTVGSAGEFKVGTAVTISSTAGVSTFSGDVIFDGATEDRTITWDKSDNALKIADNTNINIGTGNDLKLYHDGTNSIIDNTTGMLQLRADSFRLYNQAGSENMIDGTANGSIKLYYDNTARYETTGAGSTSVGISTFQDFSSLGMLKERVEIVANKLSAGVNIDLEKGNIWYYSTNETTTATPNIRYSSSKTLNNAMLVGESVSVTIIYKPNGAGYYAQLAIDGSASTEEWLGGSAPSSANAGGYDVLTHTIIKTGSGSWINLANVQNFA